MIRITNFIISGFALLCVLIPADRKFYSKHPTAQDPYRQKSVAKIGDNPFPTNPMNDRAVGYLDQGLVKNAITNYGSFINWDNHPSGIWRDYSYLPAVSFIAAVPGYNSSSNFSWENLETVIDEDGIAVYSVWSSQDAYLGWFPSSGDTLYRGILFELGEDDGVYAPDKEVFSVESFTTDKQFMFDNDEKKIYISTFSDSDPNTSSARVGLIYPWALRPRLISREEQFDFYDYGPDLEEWTSDDDYAYYGANSAESHFINTDYKTDWHAANMSRVNSHQTETTAGDVFGETPWTDDGDTYPVLAHSAYSDTWPTRLNEST